MHEIKKPIPKAMPFHSATERLITFLFVVLAFAIIYGISYTVLPPSGG